MVSQPTCLKLYWWQQEKTNWKPKYLIPSLDSYIKTVTKHMNREDYAKLFPSIQGLSTSNQIGVYRNKANIFKKSIPKKKKKNMDHWNEQLFNNCLKTNVTILAQKTEYPKNFPNACSPVWKTISKTWRTFQTMLPDWRCCSTLMMYTN